MTKKTPLKISILGCGGCGSAIADVLAHTGHNPILWGRDNNVISAINKTHENYKYLPAQILHKNILATNKLEDTINSDFFVFALPCQQIRPFLLDNKTMFKKDTIIINVAKGIDLTSNSTPQGIFSEILGANYIRYIMLSGPSFATEIVKKLPTAVVLGCADKKLGTKMQQIFSTSWFRCYYSKDVVGVELGGALKNVLAIAAGVCDGLELGNNARAALITRGLAEMSRIGLALGAKAQTFSGLSGLGDVLLSCVGDLSRNRQVGLRLGRGETLPEILKSFGTVAEGVKTAFAVKNLIDNLNINAPITSATTTILNNSINLKQIVMELMTRNLKAE